MIYIEGSFDENNPQKLQLNIVNETWYTYEGEDDPETEQDERTRVEHNTNYSIIQNNFNIYTFRISKTAVDNNPLWSSVINAAQRYTTFYIINRNPEASIDNTTYCVAPLVNTGDYYEAAVPNIILTHGGEYLGMGLIVASGAQVYTADSDLAGLEIKASYSGASGSMNVDSLSATIVGQLMSGENGQILTYQSGNLVWTSSGANITVNMPTATSEANGAMTSTDYTYLHTTVSSVVDAFNNGNIITGNNITAKLSNYTLQNIPITNAISFSIESGEDYNINTTVDSEEHIGQITFTVPSSTTSGSATSKVTSADLNLTLYEGEWTIPSGYSVGTSVSSTSVYNDLSGDSIIIVTPDPNYVLTWGNLGTYVTGFNTSDKKIYIQAQAQPAGSTTLKANILYLGERPTSTSSLSESESNSSEP